MCTSCFPVALVGGFPLSKSVLKQLVVGMGFIVGLRNQRIYNWTECVMPKASQMRFPMKPKASSLRHRAFHVLHVQTGDEVWQPKLCLSKQSSSHGHRRHV